MHERARAVGERKLERAIILQLLSDDGARRWSRTELAGALDAEPDALEGALVELSNVGVVDIAGAEVWASVAARRIDELGLIGI
jgi:hypothetical protein